MRKEVYVSSHVYFTVCIFIIFKPVVFSQKPIPFYLFHTAILIFEIYHYIYANILYCWNYYTDDTSYEETDNKKIYKCTEEKYNSSSFKINTKWNNLYNMLTFR